MQSGSWLAVDWYQSMAWGSECPALHNSVLSDHSVYRSPESISHSPGSGRSEVGPFSSCQNLIVMLQKEGPPSRGRGRVGGSCLNTGQWTVREDTPAVKRLYWERRPGGNQECCSITWHAVPCFKVIEWVSHCLCPITLTQMLGARTSLSQDGVQWGGFS